jgi:hypothetical protein
VKQTGERLKNPSNPQVLPDGIWEEYEAGTKFKSGLGKRGLYEQGRINKRFFIGDQWHGARCGNDRPLVRHNLIKRIGEYKMARTVPVRGDISCEVLDVENVYFGEDALKD